jgi:glycosyltransferase involved in cell wall biosynthesis
VKALPHVGLALPLLNEAAGLHRVVEELLATQTQAGLPLTLALVDNGSTDGTRAAVTALAARHAEVIPVLMNTNLGYGGGILAGMAALEACPEVTFLGWAWGDGQVHPSVLPVLAAALAEGADLAKARRVVRRDGLGRLAVTTVYGWVCRAKGFATPDVNGCPKLWTRAAWARMPRDESWLLDALCVAEAERLGLTVADAPVVMERRQAGQSKVRMSTVRLFAERFARLPRVVRPTGAPGVR